MKKTSVLLIAVIILALIFSLSTSIVASTPSPIPIDPDARFRITFPKIDIPLWRPAFPTPTLSKLFLSDAEKAMLGNMQPGECLTVVFTMPFFWADEELIWTSSDTSVATVRPLEDEDHHGQVCAVGSGTALITVNTPDGAFTRTFEVFVH